MMINAKMIKELRERTGAGVMSCKQVLTETNGDMNRAMEKLKEKEAEKAAKKAERTTTEGIICACIAKDKKAGAMVEVNCETDFVSANKDFILFAENMAAQILNSDNGTIEEIMQESYIGDGSLSVKDALTSLIAKFGENITIKNKDKFIANNGIIYSYIHNKGRIGAMLELACNKHDDALNELAKEIALHIAAVNPLYVSVEEVDQEIIEKEKNEARQLAVSENKPERIIDKIVMGKIKKYYKQNCLLQQSWIKDEELTIADLLNKYSEKLNSNISIKRFAKYERVSTSDAEQQI